MQDESASVQVYVLNPCAVAIPQQQEQQLILSLASAHCNITEGGVPEATDKASAATSKPYQVQARAQCIPATSLLQSSTSLRNGHTACSWEPV